MKTCIKHVRHCACRELIEYRSIYYLYRTWEIVTDDQLKHLYNHYIMITWIYACGLISASTIDRAHYMFVEIQKLK